MEARRDNLSESIEHNPQIKLAAGPVSLNGYLEIPRGAQSLVLFIHEREHPGYPHLYQPRLCDRYLAKLLNKVGIATLLIDLLTPEEVWINQRARQLRFDSNLFAYRLERVTDWLHAVPLFQGLDIGYLGTGMGSAAALIAASKCSINAVVSLEGRPDLAGMALASTYSPTLLIVGGRNSRLIAVNREALNHLAAEKCLKLVSGASHLLSEPRSLEQAANFSGQWFQRYRSPTLND